MLRELHFAFGHAHVVVSTYGIAVVVAVIVGATLAMCRPHARDAVWVTLALGVPAVLAGAMGLHAVMHGNASRPGGMSSMGGVVGLLVATAVAARVARAPLPVVLDAVAPAAAVALAIGRIGCFLAGCCYGRPTDLPWGVVFPELGAPARHPLQLYSAVGDIALLAALPVGPPGTVAAAVAVRFGLLRAALETFRDPAATDVLVGGLTLAQVATLLLVAAALACSRRRDADSSAPDLDLTPRRK